MKRIAYLSFFVGLVMVSLGSCGKSSGKSDTTGWKLGDQKWGGYDKADFKGQPTGPNLVLIPGGTFAMGMTDGDVTYEWNNVPRRVTVSSFYMDETEVSNFGYREYIYWLSRVHGETSPALINQARPDSLVWREELSYNEPFVENYFQHPAYDDYPVVGVTWEQAVDYCAWRTDRVNEAALIESGILNPNPDQKDTSNFNTEAYLWGLYKGDVRKNLKDGATGGERAATRADGMILPSYRLPTEAEWEYAALGLEGLQDNNEERISDRRIYPWDGNTARFKKRNKHQGEMLANFKRGRGDYMGMAGKLNDNSHIPGPIRAFWPNDYGLYNMAGNVSEWVSDIYRPMTSTTLRDVENHDLNPYRGNEFKTLALDEDGRPVGRDSLGRMIYRDLTDEEVEGRDNYSKANLIDFKDGDTEEILYAYGKTTLISDHSRVIKGGSWADRLYWLSPGTRRFFDEGKGSKSIGFRCAMTRLGGANGNDDAGGNFFKRKTKKRK